MVFAILLRFVDHISHFFPMVANYWSSDAVFAEGLNNKEDVYDKEDVNDKEGLNVKEDVNDKVNKRVDGIMDPFKEVLNLPWGISSISFPRRGTNEDEWEEGRKDKQTYLEISTQIKCALVINSCTTLSIQRLRRIKLYLLLFNLLPSSTFCRISYWELWQIRLPERRSESGPGSSFWRSRIFFVPLWVVQLHTLSLLYQFYTASSSALCLSFVTSFMGLK